MPADAQELRTRLLATDEEFRELATKHQELETRLLELSRKHYLTDAEQLEEVTLKKRKLQIKDRMEALLRRHRDLAAPSVVESASPSPAASR